MSEKKIVLKSSDGESFELDEAVAVKSKTIANIIGENCVGDAAISIQEVKSNILKLVMDYCKKHVGSYDSLTDESKEDLKNWDAEFMKMEQSTLIPVIQAAKHLNIKDLLDLCCQTIADIIKDKTAEEIRTYFNLEKALTEEQEEEIRSNFLNSLIFHQELSPTMSAKTIILKSSDGEFFTVYEAVALKSKTIEHTIEDTGNAAYVKGLRILEVESKILRLVIEYCKKHVESDDSLTDETKADLEKWDTEFMEMEQDTLFDVLKAANYLSIRDLLDICCQTVADIIKDKTVEQVRTYFNIEKDFTEEEEEEIRQKNNL